MLVDLGTFGICETLRLLLGTGRPGAAGNGLLRSTPPKDLGIDVDALLGATTGAFEDRERPERGDWPPTDFAAWLDPWPGERAEGLDVLFDVWFFNDLPELLSGAPSSPIVGRTDTNPAGSLEV